MYFNFALDGAHVILEAKASRGWDYVTPAETNRIIHLDEEKMGCDHLRHKR
jgi:hypothetical protein